MVGLASCSGKKAGYGIVRKGQSATCANKPHKSSHGSTHTKRDLSASQETGIVSNEPLNDPNWRRRRAHNGQDNSTTATPKNMELLVQDTPLATFSSHHNFSPFVQDSMKQQPSAQEVLKKSEVEFEHSTNPHCYTGDDSLGWSAYSNFLGSHMSGNHFFDVVRHAKLHGQGQGRTLDLFGVACSHDSSYSDKRCTIARLSSGDESVDDRFLQMISRKHTLTPDESQGYQLMAALKATESTPRKIGHTSSIGQDTSRRLSCLSEQSLLQNDKILGVIEPCRLDSKDSGFSFASGSQQDFNNGDAGIDAGASNTSGHQQHALEQKDIAFQKLIKRLNGASSQEKKSVDRSRDSGYEPEPLRTQQPQTRPTGTAPVPATRRPTHGTGRRVNTASDFAVRYWPVSESRRGDHSTDSTARDAPDKYNSLNPKAREFLSFSQKTENTPWKGRRPALLSFDISIDEQVDEPSRREVLASEPAHKAPAARDNQFVAPNGAVTVPYMNATSIPLLFQPFPHSSASFLGLIPLMPDASKPLMAQPGVWPTSHAVTPIPDTCVPLQTKSFMPPITQNQLFNGLASPCSQPKIGVPNTSSVPPVAQTNNSLPRRVPKPKQPNSKDQQEYEAWVEWRKATEPGYAMACKLRQQRRAQRNGPKAKQNQSKPGSE
ncbi:hypothetical protein MAC_04328 [Metarhizium acridum CQMa 102]|uniref:Uncharacterized protein n=1 Tax=Metarhizium acridum (strain CQMa 102) TaxID=655827 RepID=E9E380_METAQ|nr:uncharacterized protein MAC_04328 [Metarhizium acridum CQMa 102]EFY89675.1 hypothetical protein MAC_04328 [Metarhizium acridum CQMa 102]